MNQHVGDATTVQITTLRVNGMACDGCAAHVAGTLEDINGVVHVDVHRRQGKFVVEHLPAFVDAVTIAATIRSLGYGAEVAATVLDVECPRPAPHPTLSNSCHCCVQPASASHWTNLGTRTIG
jgi:copper chaperone CopZ